jgi:hypothetical protein
MARIRTTFEDAQLAANAEQNDEALLSYLANTDVQFRSVAYEGAAMSRGLADICSNNGLNRWRAFEQRAKPHSVQIHIGLGWALAQRQIPILPAIYDLPFTGQARVLDGCGYYDGMFRHRSSVRDKIIPEEINGDDLHAYDQGVGRSLWYMAKGEINTLVKLVDGFSDSRKPDLWRGIGIAVTYVGGCDKLMLASILDRAASYQISLASGAALLARARAHADTPNPDADLTCRIWCHMSADEAVALMDETEPSNEQTNYFRWMELIEDALRKHYLDLKL